jgi:hypothetical protein
VRTREGSGPRLGERCKNRAQQPMGQHPQPHSHLTTATCQRRHGIALCSRLHAATARRPKRGAPPITHRAPRSLDGRPWLPVRSGVPVVRIVWIHLGSACFRQIGLEALAVLPRAGRSLAAPLDPRPPGQPSRMLVQRRGDALTAPPGGVLPSRGRGARSRRRRKLLAAGTLRTTVPFLFS